MSQVQKYWDSKPAHVVFMILNRDAETIDPLERKEVFSFLPDISGKTVLDLGAGIGRFTTEFVKKAKEVTAIDQCAHFTTKNQKKNKKAKCICMNAMEAEFAPNSFDLVFITCLLMYLDDDQAKNLLKKAKTWLKPKGHLFFCESCAAVTHDSDTVGYPARYRSLQDYGLLASDFKTVQADNLKTYEELLADPFKCYWLCKK